MHSTLSTVLAPLDRETVVRERDELREQLQDCEAVLRLIDRHQCNSRGCGSAATPAVTSPVESSQTKTNGHGPPTNGNGQHVPVTHKRDAVLAILREKPGRWETAEMRAALTERGIDPLVGTPVKNILWKMAKDGIVHASGNGVYEFPALNAGADDEDEQEAMGL
jgi:hypothetical protein